MFLFRTRAIGACAVIASIALHGVHAQTPNEAEDVAGLTLGQAIERVLATNPSLQSFAFALRAGDARVSQAAQQPATEASFELENVLGSGETRGLDSAEATFALSRVVELGEKRALRGAAARAGRDLVSVERQAAQLDVLAEVTRRYIHVAALQEQQQLTRSGTELARRTVADVERRVAVARSPKAELLRARAALATAELEELRAGQQLVVGRRQLAALWGAPDDTFGPIRADLYRVSEPATFESLAARLDANPDFLRFASEARLRDAELRLASSLRRPDVQVSGGVRRLEGSNDQALVFGVSVPLFAGRRAAPAVAEAIALRDLVGAERTAAMLNARTRLFELHQELRHAAAETRTIKDEVLPQLDEALTQTEYAYERGRYGYLELVDAQRARREARGALIDAAERGQTLQVEIERLTAESLEAVPQQLSDERETQ